MVNLSFPISSPHFLAIPSFPASRILFKFSLCRSLFLLLSRIFPFPILTLVPSPSFLSSSIPSFPLPHLFSLTCSLFFCFDPHHFRTLPLLVSCSISKFILPLQFLSFSFTKTVPLTTSPLSIIFSPFLLLTLS